MNNLGDIIDALSNGLNGIDAVKTVISAARLRLLSDAEKIETSFDSSEVKGQEPIQALLLRLDKKLGEVIYFIENEREKLKKNNIVVTFEFTNENENND